MFNFPEVVTNNSSDFLFALFFDISIKKTLYIYILIAFSICILPKNRFRLTVPVLFPFFICLKQCASVHMKNCLVLGTCLRRPRNKVNEAAGSL